MKAITLYEPWASLMAIGAKVNETRPVRIKHRGDICIHAAQRQMVLPNATIEAVIFAHQMRQLETKYHYGHIVAVVEIWDVVSSDEVFKTSLFSAAQCDYLTRSGMLAVSDEEYVCGNYAPGRWIYRTRNLRRLKVPVPTRGYQCVGWTVPPAVESQVLQQLESSPLTLVLSPGGGEERRQRSDE